MNKYLSIILSLLAFFVGQTSMAADVPNFDIAGVKLAMNVADVEAAAAARGFTERDRSRAPDFYQAARQQNSERVNPNKYAGFHQIIFSTDSEDMQINFVPMPDGIWIVAVQTAI